MVSGLVTSPYDHPRIDSADARLMRIASKLFTSSTRPRSRRSPRLKPRDWRSEEPNCADAVSVDSRNAVSVIGLRTFPGCRRSCEHSTSDGEIGRLRCGANG